MDDRMMWPVGERRVLWLRHGYHDNPTMRDAVCAWTEANGLDPDKVSANDPIVVRGSERLCEGPKLTVVVILDAGEEPEACDRWLPGKSSSAHPRRVWRTVPLKVAPPPDLFLDVAAEIQRAAADPEFRAWVAERVGDAEPPSGPETGPGSPPAGQDGRVRGSGRAEPSGEAVRRAELDTQLAAIAAGDLASFEASAKAVGYDAAVAELRGVVERTGSPAARWAADYLAASSVRSAALGDAR